MKPKNLIEDEKVHQLFTVEAKAGTPITAEKFVVLFSNMDKGILEVKESALNQVLTLSGRETVYK